MKIETSAAAHTNSPFLNATERCWWNQHQSHKVSPYEDYKHWEGLQKKWVLQFILEGLLFVEALLIFPGTPFWTHGNIGIYAAIAGILIVVMFISICVRRHKEDLRPVIWDEYHADLTKLLESFPDITDGGDMGSENLIEMFTISTIGRDLATRAAQIKAKQGLGLLKDAQKEREEALELHALAKQFGFVKEFGYYFKE
ncbi:MAG: hypothetical protein RIT04_233 [Candidatus Parcubacteria bacterium]|jgi:hypothetical protein